jgi:hypothetical protein
MNDLQETDEFDGRLYALSYIRPDGTRQATEPVGAKSIAALGAERALFESSAPSTSQTHKRNIVERLRRDPVGTDIADWVTGIAFRIDVVGQLPTTTTTTTEEKA